MKSDKSEDQPSAGDFRFRRYKLPPEAFLIHPEHEPEPTDLIDAKTWGHITTLPDDVSIRASERHGTLLKDTNQFTNHWIELTSDVQGLISDPKADALALSCLDAYDDFRASIYTALTGYYRQSRASLRYALEEILAGAYFRAYPDPVKIHEWAEGYEKGRLRMGRLREALSKKEPYSRFENGENTIFSKDGWVEFLYACLSAYSHGRPYYMLGEDVQIPTSCMGLWGGSNGPVYEYDSVIRWSKFFFETALFCQVMLGLAEGKLLTEHPISDRYYIFLEHTLTRHPHYSHPGLFPVIGQIIVYLCGPHDQ